MKTNIRQNLIKSMVALLIVIPVLVGGIHLIRQNYKRHHYFTIRSGGRYPGEHKVTEEKWDEISRKATLETQKVMDDRRRKLHPHN